ncbi:S-adenosyl-L-methionine-dependent methyltransferase [Aspergillus recurvatus]
MKALSRHTSRSLYLSPHLSHHFRTSSLKDPKNVWKLTQQDHGSYWSGYLSTRPKYTDSFYELIYSYHAAHFHNKPTFSIAHDVGAGPGHVAADLATRFSRVIVSDINERHIEYAKQFLSSSSPSAFPSRFSYCLSKAEDLSSKYPKDAGSADLVACALTVPLLDTLPALQSFHKLLKPGGTLAIWFYGRAHFAEPEYARTCQPLLDEIINHHYAGVIQGHGAEHTAQWRSVAERIASWLDYIPFDKGEWEDVTRYKWNSSWADLGFFTEKACGFPIDTLPRGIKEGDVVIEQDDREMWRMDWNVNELRKFVEYIFPFERLDEEPVRQWWTRLEKEMGGLAGRRGFSWPVVLILATKK